MLEGQFLVFRQLEILSPSFEHSKADKAEMRDFKGDAADPQAKRKWPEKPEQILVTIVAAGMDFFDPLKDPLGLHPESGGSGKAQNRKGTAETAIGRIHEPQQARGASATG